MSKQILGEDPFADPAAEGATPAADDDKRGKGKRRADKPAGAAAATAGEPTPAPAAPAPAAADPAPVAPPPAAAVEAVPDEVVPAATPWEPSGIEIEDAFEDDERMFGAEAVVPEGEYGPPIPSVLPDRKKVTDEIRELERRVRARLTPAFPIEHRRRLPMQFLWNRYRKLAMRDRSDIVDEFGRDPVYAGKVEPVLDFLYKRYFRVDTSGVANIPDVGRALLVANHSGTLPYDGALLMYAVRKEHAARRDIRPLVEDFVFHFPYLGTFINRIGGVRACQENAERLLEDEQVVAVFPEGIKGIGKLYRERYKLQRFGRGGFIKLALRTGAPIIPVAIVGAEEIHPMMVKVTWFAKSLGIPYVPITPTFPLLGPVGALPLPTKWYLKFGEPIDLSAQHGPEAASDRILVNRLAETVRGRIQQMLDDTLARRRSVLFG